LKTEIESKTRAEMCTTPTREVGSC